MRVKLWGVRGSLPTPLTPNQIHRRIEEVLVQFEQLQATKNPKSARDFIASLPQHMVGGYGGNTVCGEVRTERTRLIIDGGSGLRGLSEQITRDEPDRTEHHIYFTHYHWDHLIGLPFFAPFYAKGHVVHCYGVHPDLEDNVKRMFAKPNFPVPFAVIAPQVKFHVLTPRRPVTIGDLTLTPYELDHPDPCWGARIESDGMSIAWSVDTECARVSREEMGDDVKLYSNADLMVFDAQYTFGQALEKINWGHSSGPIGIDIAIRENVRTALFVHHDPAATDQVIRQAEEQTLHYYDQIIRARDRAGHGVPRLVWRFAREGEVVEMSQDL